MGPMNEKIRGKAECDTLCKKDKEDKEDKDKEVKLIKDDWFCSGTKDKGGKCAKKFCRLTRPKKDDEFPAHGICYSDAKEDTKEKCGDTECIVLAAQVGDPKNEKIRGKAECDTLCKNGGVTSDGTQQGANYYYAALLLFLL